MSSPSLRLARGIYVPTITFFNDDEEQSLDFESHKQHILWMARAGVRGFLVQGSTGEAVALTPAEKILITRATREVLDDNGFKEVLVIAGAGAQSTLEAVSLANDAKKAGADHIIVLPPAYFASSITKDALEEYYLEVANKSPLPVLIYSYPGASGGLEITSDTISFLARHPNIVGVKQTDHNVGKMARNVYQTSKEDFTVLGGATDYLIGALAVGASGAITGLANITPRTLVRLFELYEAEKYDEAKELQGIVSSGEWALLEGSIPSIKAATGHFLGRGGVPRRPIPASSAATLTKVNERIKPIFDIENKLESEAKNA